MRKLRQLRPRLWTRLASHPLVDVQCQPVPQGLEHPQQNEHQNVSSFSSSPRRPPQGPGICCPTRARNATLMTGRIKFGQLRFGTSLPLLVNTIQYVLTRCSALSSFHPHCRIDNPGLWDAQKEDSEPEAQEGARPGKSRSVLMNRKTTACSLLGIRQERDKHGTFNMSVKLLILWSLTCTDDAVRHLAKCHFCSKSPVEAN